jgi:hypothetical protein
MLYDSSRHRQNLIPLAGMQDKKKVLQRIPEARSERRLKMALRRFPGWSLRARRGCWYIRFRAAETPHCIRALAPEDGDLRGPGLLGLAVLALALRADEPSVQKDMVALVERVGDGFAEANFAGKGEASILSPRSSCHEIRTALGVEVALEQRACPGIRTWGFAPTTEMPR